jgi:hypothetical protein
MLKDVADSLLKQFFHALRLRLFAMVHGDPLSVMCRLAQTA